MIDPARCGDGRLDPGERCDPGVQYAPGCPDGWGVCQVCAGDCQRTLAWPPNTACRIDKERRVDSRWEPYWSQECQYDDRGWVRSCRERTAGQAKGLTRDFGRTSSSETVSCLDASTGERYTRTTRRDEDEGTLTLEIDADGDGAIDQRSTHRAPAPRVEGVDGLVEPNSEEVLEVTSGAPETSPWKATRRYDARGNLVFYEWVAVGNPTPASLPCDPKDRGLAPGCRTSVTFERAGRCEPFEHRKTFEYGCLAAALAGAPMRAFVERDLQDGGDP
ncbi:MAG: hypothetical protein AAGF12_22020 [Myxococcota bacterium]